MAHPNEDLVREGFAAFGRGDMDALRKQYWTDDVRWHIPGRSPFAGDYEGPEPVIQAFARLFELSGGTFGIEQPRRQGAGGHPLRRDQDRPLVARSQAA